MRGSRSTPGRRSTRALALFLFSAASVFGLLATPAWAAPTAGDITSDTASICLTYPAATDRRFVILDGAESLSDSPVGFEAGKPTCVAIDGLDPATTYTLTVKTGAPGAADADLVTEGTVTFTTARYAPAVPGEVRQIQPSTADVCFSTTGTLNTYLLYDGTRKLAEREYYNSGFVPCVTVTGLTPSTEYTITIKYRAAGAQDADAEYLDEVTFKTIAGNPTPPEVRGVTTNSAEICATGPRPTVPTRYVVFENGTKIAEASTSCQIVKPISSSAPDFSAHRFTLKSGPVGTPDADLFLEGSVLFTTAFGPPPSAKDITATTVSICPGGQRAPMTYSYSVYDGDTKLAEHQGRYDCFTVTGLKPDTAYSLTLRSGGSAIDGYIDFRTLPVTNPNPPEVRDLSATSARICLTGIRPAVVERMVIFNGATKVGEGQTNCVTVTGLQPNTDYTLTAKAGALNGTDDAALRNEGTVSFRTLENSFNDAQVQGADRTSATICTVRTPQPAVYVYSVYEGDTKLVEGGTACLKVTGLSPSREYTFTLRRRIAGGTDANNQVIGSVTFTTATGPVPGPPRAQNVSATTAEICLTGERPELLRHVILDGTTKVSESTDLCQVITGLSPSTTYTLTVKTGPIGSTDESTYNTDGSVTFTTAAAEPTFIDYPFTLSGAATLKTLTKGSLPLTGSIAAKINAVSGEFTADLSLNKTSGNLVALGFLPVTANVTITATDQVTGSLKGGKLNAVAKVRIKLPSVKLFGIELAGGANCQAKSVSSIPLASTQATFLPTVGGGIAGTFGISDLTGCGALTGIVSPLTKGNGNAITLNLAPVKPTK